MGRHHLTLILVLLLCIIVIPVVLLVTTNTTRQENMSVAESVVQQVSFSDQPITVGVILVNPADQYGWAVSGEYAETTSSGSRVIVYDNLNPTARPGVTLEQVLSGMLERGARYIFVSSAYLSSADEARVAEKYPNTVFIMNLATRADVETLLAALPFTASDMGQVPAAVAPAASGQPEPETPTQDRNPPVLLIPAIIILLVGGAIMSAWWNNVRVVPDRKGGKRKRGLAGLHGKALAIEEVARGRATNFEVLGELSPLMHRFSTYVNGDIHFDESFPIETGGKFLGECGMGPSEAVSRYDREKIAAFEVWVFDKNDLRTVTHVLLSEHAFDDKALQAKLQTKGELLLAEPDMITTLETKTLRVQVRVLDMQYGFSDTLSPRSFFEHLVVEIAVWQK